MNRDYKPPNTLLGQRFSGAYTESLFEAISRFMGAEDSALFLDTFNSYVCSYDYINSYSYERLPSPIIERLAVEYQVQSGRSLPEDCLVILAQNLAQRFGDTWKKRYAAYSMQYNATTDWGYDAEGSESTSRDDSLTHGHAVSTTGSLVHGENVYTTDAGSHENLVVGSNAAQSYTFGFNTNDNAPVPSQRQDGSSSTSDTGSSSSSGSVTHSGTDTNSSSTTNSGVDRTQGTGNRRWSETYAGMRGRHSYQELAQAERDLWKEDFLHTVYDDINSVLALKVY